MYYRPVSCLGRLSARSQCQRRREGRLRLRPTGRRPVPATNRSASQLIVFAQLDLANDQLTNRLIVYSYYTLMTCQSLATGDDTTGIQRTVVTAVDLCLEIFSSV